MNWKEIKKKFPLSTLDIFWNKKLTQKEADELKNKGVGKSLAN